MADAIMYLSVACPFGKPLCTELELVDAALSESSPARTQSFSTGVIPVWRASTADNTNSSKAIVHMTLSEQIRFSQHDSSSHTSSLRVTGTLTVRSSLPNITAAPELSFKLNGGSCGASSRCHFHRLLTSPYTSYWESSAAGVIIRCVPPLDRTFTALQYTVMPTSEDEALELPVTGFYQLQVEGDVANLRLRLRTANWFVQSAVCEYFRVRLALPAACREVQQLHCSSGSATLDAASEKRVVVWTLAANYPRGATSVEEALTGVLRLRRRSGHPASAETLTVAESEFAAFAQVQFRAGGITLSGGSIDAKSVLLCGAPSNTKLKVTVTQELVTADCRIWNSLGEAPNAFRPSEDMLLCAGVEQHTVAVTI